MRPESGNCCTLHTNQASLPAHVDFNNVQVVFVCRATADLRLRVDMEYDVYGLYLYVGGWVHEHKDNVPGRLHHG